MTNQVSRVEHGLHMRLRHGLRRPANWFQLVRFAAVGASGYVVNLAVFAACVHLLSIDYRIAAFLAFLVAVMNNFIWNRLWTFDARHGHAGHQSLRFFAVSTAAFCFNLIALLLLVSVMGMAEVPAQAISIVIATPVSFAGNKLWSFAR